MTTLAAHTTAALTLAEVKLQLILDDDDDSYDDLLERLIGAASNVVFQHCGIVCGEATATQYFDNFSDVLKLKAWPVTSLTSITYVPTSAITYTGSVATNTVRLVSGHGASIHKPIAGWPTDVADAKQVVKVVYVAGSTGDIAHAAKQAMLLLITFWFQNREDMPIPSNVTRSVHSLLAPYRQYA